MRVANIGGRARILRSDLAYDVERASQGRLPSDMAALYECWDEFASWASTVDWSGAASTSVVSYQLSDVGAPSPRPRQVFAIGLNYRKHATEAHLDLPSAPVVFTKFPSCLAGAYSDVELRSGTIDWEVELVVVVGRGGADVSADKAWEHVAGVCVGQDISDRVVQGRPPVPQFCVGKSFPTFGPFGPAIVTLDELSDPDNLELRCAVNGQEVQRERSSDLIFSVPELVEYLSSTVGIHPGDVIFTGTPSGVGSAREPKWFLQPGDVIESELVGLSSMRNSCVVRGYNSTTGGNHANSLTAEVLHH